MTWRNTIHKCAVAAVVASGISSVAAFADPAELKTLLDQLSSADAESAPQIEGQIWELWSQSGSPAMDLLLDRGRRAVENGDLELAIQHFSALIDHAPRFAEGYNARATAYYLQSRFGQSIDDIRKTLELNPNHFGAIAGLALILEELGKPVEALDAWRQVQKIHPQSQGSVEAILRLETLLEGQEI